MAKQDSVYFTPEDSPVRPNPFDTRVRMRSLSRALITAAELKKHLQSLPDDTASANYRSLEALLNEQNPDLGQSN
jgi:hypothetical protein